MSLSSKLSEEETRARGRLETLQAAVNEFVDVYNRLPVGHHSVDRNGVFTQMNDTELRWLGYTREQVLGKLHVSNIMTLSSVGAFRTNFARLAERDALYDLEYEFVRKDGTSFPVLLSVFAVRDAQGTFAGARATVVDVSALKRAEQAVRRSEEGLRQAQRVARFGNYEAARSSRGEELLPVWSAETYNILGLDAAQGPLLTQKFLQRHVHEDDRARITTLLEGAFQNRERLDCEYRIVRADGEVRHVRDVAEFRRGANGEVIGFFGVIQDITELKLARQHVEDSERRFRQLVEHGHDGIVLLSSTGQIMYASRTAERLLGYCAAELVGRPSSDFCHPRSAPDVQRVLAKLLNDPKQAVVHEYCIHRKDGSERWVEVHQSNCLADPAIGAIVCNFRDITERKAVLDELQRSNEALRELSEHLRNVREAERTRLARELHDEFGATLAAMKMYLGGPPQPNAGISSFALEQVRSLVDKAVEATRRITTELRPGILDHGGLWPAIDWLVQETCDAAGLGYRCELEEVRDLVLKEEQSTTVFRIAQEALRNAVKHAAAKTIFLRARPVGGGMLLEIQDDGVGASESDLRKAGSWGIVGMQERARACGATFQLSSVPSGGTLVQLQLPLEA